METVRAFVERLQSQTTRSGEAGTTCAFAGRVDSDVLATKYRLPIAEEANGTTARRRDNVSSERNVSALRHRVAGG